MSLLQATLLGFIQGASEFLPISSSGHLVMAEVVMGIDVSGVVFEVAVHVATLVSILLVYRTRVSEIVVGAVSGDPDANRYIALVGVATVPAGLLGVLAQDRIEALFENPYAPGVALLVTGALLWSVRGRVERAEGTRPGWIGAFIIGVAQAFALVPGISRSGATIVAAVWLGLEAREAAAFSFLMAVPAIAGAAMLQIPELGEAGAAGLSAGAVAVGSLVAAIVGVLAIRTLVAMLARRSFHWFAPYCWCVGAAYLLFLSRR